MNRLFSRSRGGRATAAQDGTRTRSQHDHGTSMEWEQHNQKATVVFAAANDDDITDHDHHHVSSRTGGFEMGPRNDDYSSDEGQAQANGDNGDDDNTTLQDCSIYTDPYKIVGAKSKDGSTVILHNDGDNNSSDICSTATTVQLTPRERHEKDNASPLYTGDIERSIEVYKRALRVQSFSSTSPPRIPTPPSSTNTIRARTTRMKTPMPATPTVIEVRQRPPTPLTPVTRSSNNSCWTQRTTITTPSTATTTTTTPSPNNNSNSKYSEKSAFWQSSQTGDQSEHDKSTSLLKSWSLRGRRRARPDRPLASSLSISCTNASTTTAYSRSSRLDPQLEGTYSNSVANLDAAATPVPCNLLSNRFRLVGQIDTMPMNDNDDRVEEAGRVRNGKQGLSEEEQSSHENEPATSTSAATTIATTNTATTATSSSPSSNGGSFVSFMGDGDDLDRGFEIVGFATSTQTTTTCTPVQEEDAYDKDGADDSSASSAHSSSPMELDLQVNNFNVSDFELMRDVQNPGALRLTAEGLESHERQSLQQAVTMHGHVSGDNSNGNDNENDNTFEQWRRAKLEQKWLRKKHKERQEKLTDQNIRIRQSLQQPQQQQHTSTPDTSKQKDAITQKRGGASKNLLVAIKSNFVKDDEVEEMSLAPLNTMDNLDLKIGATDEFAPTKASKFAIFGLFRSKRSDVSATARALLQKERHAAAEAHTEKKIREQRERHRIERNRQAYLEKQRMKESGMAPIHTFRVFPEPSPGAADWI